MGGGGKDKHECIHGTSVDGLHFSAFIFAGEFQWQGITIFAETTILVTNSEQNFEWKEDERDFGLRVNISQNSLPADVERVYVHIKASIAGQYQFPDDCHLVSPVIWFECQPKCSFEKPIILKMQHCAVSQNVSELNFVKASCNQDFLPYVFKKMDGKGITDDQYGVTQLNRFSGIAVTHKLNKRSYCAQMYNIRRSKAEYDVDFVVVWNTNGHREVSINLLCVYYDEPYSVQYNGRTSVKIQANQLRN